MLTIQDFSKGVHVGADFNSYLDPRSIISTMYI